MNRHGRGQHGTARAAATAAAALIALGGPAGCASQAARSSSSSPSPVPSPATSSGCATGTVELGFRVGDQPPGEVCLHVGASVGLTWFATPGYEWTPITSSAAGIVSASPRTTDGGPAAGSALAHALAPGVAELSATASSIGDASGPPTVRWRVTIRVVP